MPRDGFIDTAVASSPSPFTGKQGASFYGPNFKPDIGPSNSETYGRSGSVPANTRSRVSGLDIAETGLLAANGGQGCHVTAPLVSVGHLGDQTVAHSAQVDVQIIHGARITMSILPFFLRIQGL